MTTFRCVATYKISPPGLLCVLLDPAFLAAKAERYGGAGTAEVSWTDGQGRLTMPRQIPMEHVPGPVRGLVGGGRLVQTEVWGCGRDEIITGSWRLDTGESRATIGGGHRITSGPTGSAHSVDGSVTVRLPVVGGRFAGIIAEHLKRLVESEQRFVGEWLAEH